MLLVLPFAVLCGTLLILSTERLRWVQPDESELARGLRRTGIIASSLVVAGMATLWASWAGSVNEAPFAMWGTLLAASGLVLIALKASPRRAVIGFLLALIPPAFFWLMLSIGSECARVGCSFAQEFSVVPVTVLVILAVVLSVLELGTVARKLLAGNRPDGPRADSGRAANCSRKGHGG